MPLEHLLEHFVMPSGRLILGPYSEQTRISTMYETVSNWGYKPTGYIERSNHKHEDCKTIALVGYLIENVQQVGLLFHINGISLDCSKVR